MAKDKPERPKPTPPKPKPPPSPQPRVPPSAEVAKLAAEVAAAPGDLELQRIYADALMVQGGEHAIRGELVTLALSDKSKKLTEPRRIKLAKQLEAILAGDWLEQRVVGGFVGVWTCTSQVLADRAEEVFAQEPLLHELEIQLTAHYVDTQMKAIAAQPGLARLRRLTIDGTQLRNVLPEHGWLQTLLASRYWPALEVLRLPDCILGDAGARLIAHARSMRELRDLDLTGNEISAAGAGALATSPHLRELRDLGLANNRPGRDGVLALANTTSLTSLRRIDLRDSWLEPDDTDELRERFLVTA